ncbi:MAG TPA: hypothetical protein VFO07_09160 [Roseiflexaceae bacterium]|nr:hypothetical protein [Roseiflexaceae bacterium]
MTTDEEQAHQNAILQVTACSTILHFAIGIAPWFGLLLVAAVVGLVRAPIT